MAGCGASMTFSLPGGPTSVAAKKPPAISRLAATEAAMTM
jgi:hypothetical protein